MVDFHTHILPGMDDGSKNIDESIALLQEEWRQGIDKIVLSPHYYADENSPEEFLKRRNSAWSQLERYLQPDYPELHLGAEVQYFEGICATEGVQDLCILETEYLLLEMPFAHWSERVIEDVLELNAMPNVTVILAHIERYLAMQDKTVWDLLRASGILMQSNVSFFTHWKTRHRAHSMLSRGGIHLLGSDCHNCHNRRPNWDYLPRQVWKMVERSAAYQTVSKALDQGIWLEQYE